MHGRLCLLISFFCLAACSRDDAVLQGQTASAPAEASPNVSPAPATRAQRAVADAPDAKMPGPHRKRLGAAVSQNAGCVACHAEQAAEWRGSFHQRSNTEPAYRKAFAIEPVAFCRACHAPEADPSAEPPADVSDLGVGCVSCHVTEEGVVLAALPRDGDRDPEGARVPHPLRRSIDFGRSGGCVNCHEFHFPGKLGNEEDDAAFMQTTVKEHARAPAAEKPCAECHMPLVQGRRSHSFAEVRDPAWLRRNLEAKVELTEDFGVRFTLVQPAPGHAFPTGDLFRRLEIGCEVRDAAGKLLRREVRHLARHFEVIPGQSGRQLIRDDRPLAEPKVVEMDFSPIAPAPRSSVVSWWVTYQRVATIGLGTKPEDAVVESEVPLHSGNFPWEAK